MFQRSSRAVAGALLAGAVLSIASCTNAPVTERRQFIIVSEGEATQLGVQAYQKIKAEGRVSRDARMNAEVQRVSSRLAALVDKPGYKWEYTVFEDATPNAFALPGGKIGVNTGLFKVATTEAQLAAVLGHEIGHVIANHTAERLSRLVAIQAGINLLGAASATAAQNADLLAQAATLGLVLPFSREQESEADEIGLIYMARAGYDPRESVTLWQNFERFGAGQPLEFLSDHPSSGTRIQHLQSLMPRALAAYRPRSG